MGWTAAASASEAELHARVPHIFRVNEFILATKL